MTGPSCEYCGRCLSVCPSYKHHLVETMGPRARIDLAHAAANGELQVSDRYKEILNGCLQCLACTEICGKGVDGAQIILDARLDMKKGKSGLSFEKWVTKNLLMNRKMLKWALRFGSIFQKAAPFDSNETIRHMPDMFDGIMGKRSLPVMDKKSLFEQFPEKIYPPQDIAVCGEVMLFTGCFSGLIRTEPSVRLINALSMRGYIVNLPKGQTCCGAPAQLSGYGDTFKKIQKINADIYAKYGDIPVLTLCATCHRTLTKEYKDSGKILSDHCIDATQFLYQHDKKTKFSSEISYSTTLQKMRAGTPIDETNPIVVAVHDPCHFRLDPLVGKSLREELKNKKWIRLVELPNPSSCCGGGGITSLKNPELADKLGDSRAKDVINSGADIVVAQCPGCVLQLNNHLLRNNAKQRAFHAMEILGN